MSDPHPVSAPPTPLEFLLEFYQEQQRLQTAEIDLQTRVRELKNALARYGQHALTCAKRNCPQHACDCGFFEAQK